MIYGANILSSTNWQITDGSIAGSSVTLNAGGSAIQSLQLEQVPEYIMISSVMSTYSSNYLQDVYAEIVAETNNGVTYKYLIPLVETSPGICTVETPLEPTEIVGMTFELRSSKQVTFTSISLFTPKLSDVDLTEVLDKIPRLLSGYNKTQMVIGESEDIIALISAYISETTELFSNLSFSYQATQDAELTIRIKDNDTTELFTPLIYSIEAGHGVIEIPHAYFSRSNGYHNFVVTAQSTNEILVDTRRLIYAIDGGRIVYNVMDIGSTAYDITAKKLNTEAHIAELYAVCIDDGVAIVKKTEYSELPGSAWVAIATLGNAIDAAIEFDGTWRQTTSGHVFDTIGDPWIFLVRTNGDLVALQGTTEVALATGITKVAAVRGYENPINIGEDHGLLVVYIKSGQVYYRSYGMQATSERTWDYERQLTNFVGTALDISVFRTNDYRIGINVIDTLGAVTTYLTVRNWAGMASGIEHLDASITDITFAVLPVNYIDNTYVENVSAGVVDLFFNVAEPIYPVPILAYNAAKSTTEITLKFSHIIAYDLTTVKNAFTIKDAANTTFAIISTSAGVDTSEIVFTVSQFGGASGDMSIVYDRTIIELDCMNQGSRFAIEAFIFTFTPELEPPTGYAAENLTVSIQPTFVVTQATYKLGYGVENINASIADISFVVTKVGSNPL